MQHRVDLERARQVARADLTAFGVLFEGSFGRVYAFVRSRSASDEVAQRATERILTAAFAQLPDYDGSTPLSAWLLSLVKAELRASAPRSDAALATGTPAGPRA